jgi:hypothetical protein
MAPRTKRTLMVYGTAPGFGDRVSTRTLRPLRRTRKT